MAINQRAGHVARMSGCTVAPGPPSPCLPQCGRPLSLPAWNHPGPCATAAGFFHPKQGDFMQQRPKTSLMTPLALALCAAALATPALAQDRKSTRLNSSHLVISYAVFCLKKKKINTYVIRFYLHHYYRLQTNIVLLDLISYSLYRREEFLQLVVDYVDRYASDYI